MTTWVSGGDVADVLIAEYRSVADRVDRLTAELATATDERNAVVAALLDTGLTQRKVCELTGLTITQLRTAVWNDWNTIPSRRRERPAELVAVEVDRPHPWAAGIVRFRRGDLWLFYGAKLDRARRGCW